METRPPASPIFARRRARRVGQTRSSRSSWIATASEPSVATPQAITSVSVSTPQWCAQTNDAARSATERTPSVAATGARFGASGPVAKASNAELYSAFRPAVRQLAACLEQVLRDHLDVGQHRHEVRVAVPARHDVDVAVVNDPGARDAAEVPPDVEALRREDGPQRLDRRHREPLHFERLSVLEVVERRAVPVRRDHQVTRGVRELVQEDERELAAVDHELRLVLRQRRGAAEDALVALVRVLDVLEPPRRPQPLHPQEATCASASPCSIAAMTNWLKRLFGGSGSSESEAPEPANAPPPPPPPPASTPSEPPAPP